MTALGFQESTLGVKTVRKLLQVRGCCCYPATSWCCQPNRCLTSFTSQEIRYTSGIAVAEARFDLLPAILRVLVLLVVPLGRQGQFSVQRAVLPVPVSFEELSVLVGPMLVGVATGLPNDAVEQFARGLVVVLCCSLQHQTNVRKVHVFLITLFTALLRG
jgi:hypothetical protein